MPLLYQSNARITVTAIMFHLVNKVCNENAGHSDAYHVPLASVHQILACLFAAGQIQAVRWEDRWEPMPCSRREVDSHLDCHSCSPDRDSQYHSRFHNCLNVIDAYVWKRDLRTNLLSGRLDGQQKPEDKVYREQDAVVYLEAFLIEEEGTALCSFHSFQRTGAIQVVHKSIVPLRSAISGMQQDNLFNLESQMS